VLAGTCHARLSYDPGSQVPAVSKPRLKLSKNEFRFNHRLIGSYGVEHVVSSSGAHGRYPGTVSRSIRLLASRIGQVFFVF
jgi:hypothetical protein